MAFLGLLVSLGARADTRQVSNAASADWLRGVGKLYVPGTKYHKGHRLNYNEHCSATLVAEPGKPSANTIITAWHCLEHYDDLSKAITFTLFYGTEKSITIDAYRYDDGGSMQADWALLRLSTSIADTIAPALAAHTRYADEGRPIIMAGYSTDSQDKRLSYDPSCSVASTPQSIPEIKETDCNAAKGASGGAVVQYTIQGEPLLVGVISQGNGEDLSLYVPVQVFRTQLQASLR